MALVLVGAYLLFAGAVSGIEIVAALAAAACVFVWWRGVVKRSSRRFEFDPDAVVALVGAFASLPFAFVRTGRMLVKTCFSPQQGRAGTTPFMRVRREGPRGATHRAASVLALSLAPDSFVMRVLTDRDQLDIHNLVANRDRASRRSA